MKFLSVNEMTRKQIESVPFRPQWDAKVGPFDSLIILPLRKIHDSGYRQMDFVGTQYVKDKLRPVMRLSGCSDVIHIEGIGGYGRWTGSLPQLVLPRDWCIDCLPVSGLLQFFNGKGKIVVDDSLSSFSIYASL